MNTTSSQPEAGPTTSTGPAALPGRRSNRGLKIVLLVAMFCALAGYGYRYGIRDHLIPRNFGTVDQGQIYRSGRLTPATMERIVRDNNIRTVIDLGAYEEGSVPDVLERRTAEALGARRVRFSLSGDATGNPADYVNALKIMADPANHPLLVHCAAGAQRTSAAVMLYRKAFQNVPFEQSLDEARTFGHDPEDNPKLLKYLAEHGDAIIAEAKAAVESGVGAGVGTGIGAAPVK